MAVLADFHTHSHHSGDSNTPMEAMVEAALQKGLDTICFTEHHDPGYPPCEDIPENYFTLNTDSYLYELLRLRETYRDKIQICFGVELGLQPELGRELAKYANSYDFDFIIGSTHVCEKQDVYYPAFYEGRSDEEAYRAYFEETLVNIRKFQNFDVCGHLDYVVRYGASKDADYCYEKYRDIFDQILQFLIEHEKGIELNTGGLKRGMRQPHPCLDVLRRYRELGGEIITVGSDAHTPEHLAYAFEQAADWLKECGFRYYCVFERRLPEYRKI